MQIKLSVKLLGSCQSLLSLSLKWELALHFRSTHPSAGVRFNKSAKVLIGDPNEERTEMVYRNLVWK